MARPEDKPFSVEDCFNKIKEDDSDKRFVGVQDLVNALTRKNNPVKLDAAGETKLVDKLVDMVALDTSSGVRGLAVRALGLITKTAQEANLKTMIDKLPGHLEKDKHNVKGQEITGEVRESVATCLKVVIESVPDTQTSIIDACKDKLAPRIVALGKKTNEADLMAKVLDVLSELLSKWGAHLNKKENLLTDVQKVAFPQLKSNVWACRNRASACLASVSVYANDAQLADIVQKLSAALADVSSLPEHTLSYIQAITAMSRAVGARFGPHLEHFVGTLVAIIQDPNYDEEHGDIRVAALQSFEAFLLRCPKSAEAHLEQMEELGVSYMTYDPNAVEEEEGGDDAMDEGDAFDDDDGGDNDAFGADADGGACPWKSAASHLLSTVISTRPDRLDHVYDTLVDSLIKAFKEDDDTVRSEIFNTFMAVLRQTENVSGGDHSSSASIKLKGFTEPFIKAVVKELKGKSLKTRPGAFKMSALYLQVLPGSFAKHLSEFVPGLKAAMGTKKTNSALKAEALSFFNALLSHDKKDVQGLITDLSASVYASFKDSAPQTAIAALHVASSMASVAPTGFDVGALYKATVDRLSDNSASAEVQEAVIDAVASILASSGDKLGDQVPKALSALVAKMGHENSKLAAVKAFGSLAKSKKVDLKVVVGDVLGNIIKFLPQDNRQLKVACLNALLDIIPAFGKEKAAAGHFEKLIAELVNLLGDNSLVGYAVKAIAQILHADSKAASKAVKDVVLPRVQKDLLSAALLQGLALEGVLELYEAMAKSDSKDLGADKLLAGLSEIGNDKKTPHSALKSVAQCVGVLARVGDKAGIVKKFLDEREFSLYCLGEIGRRVDLSDNAAVKDKILHAFESSSTEVRNAAAVALGSVAAGNLQKYLPDIISEMKNASRQYLLLTSIREAIVATDSEKISGFSDKLLEILFQHTDAKEEGTRTVVAESLGKLVLTNPKVIDSLAEKTGDKNPATRATVAALLRAALPDKPHPVDAIWSKKIGPFLTLIGDSEVSVRKEALLSLDLAARVKPKLIRSHLPKTLPVLYQQTNIIKELIEEKVIGIFKVIVDHGLGARQAAFGVMNTLLDTCFDAMDLTAFIDPLANGLGEEDPDVRMLSGLILVKLVKKAPNVLVAGLEKLIPSLKKGALLQPKDAKFNVEIEANLVAVTGYLRCIGHLSRLPDTAASPAWKDLITSISTAKLMEKPLQETYEKVLKTLD